MAGHYTYLLLMLGSLAMPLLLSFDKKVAFYKEWKFIFPAMLPAALFYIIWDIYFTSQGIWSFNPEYILNINFFGLPFEEILFFFVVPYCCLFIYACIKAYFPNIKSNNVYAAVLWTIASLVILIALYSREHRYTSYTGIFLGIALLSTLYFRKRILHFKPQYFVISYIIVLIPFMIVNGFLTAIPVVLYNNNENLAMRITTIPVEDIFYGMLLFLLNVLLYEHLRLRKA